MALDNLEKFEKIFKIVIIESFKVNWTYKCEDSKTYFNIKNMKTKLGRFNSLFKGKYQIVFEIGVKGIETLATCENYKGDPVVLFQGLPYETSTIRTQENNKNTFYINYNSLDQTNSASQKAAISRKQIQLITTAKPNILIKGAIEARPDLFKGLRDSYDSFKVAKHETIVPGQSRDFLKDLTVIGQFDRKAILAKRTSHKFEEIWMFDQHACAERINLEKLMKTNQNLSLEAMNMKACRSAIKFGDEIDISEQEEILKELEKCQEPFHCAHGRPTCWLLAKIMK